MKKITTGWRAIAAAALAMSAVPALAQEGDVDNGAKIFRKCAACHSIEEGAAPKIGPNLYGVVGRTTGTAEGFQYSDALMAAGAEGHVWTPEEIAHFLENPKKAFPGTKMAFAGLKKPEEQADVIAYIESVGGGS